MKAESSKKTVRLFKRHEKKYFKNNSAVIGMVGSRHYRNADKVNQIVKKLNAKDKNVIVASGGADGADALAKEAALSFKIPYLEFTPEHESANKYTIQQGRRFDKRYDAQYYFKRNYELAKFVDLLVAFIPKRYIGDKDNANGTKHTIKKAKELDTEVMVLT